MRSILSFPLILILASGTASAASTAFSIEPGHCEAFLVSGSSTPTIVVEQGDVEVTSVLFLPPNFWRIELCCVSEHVTCEGRIET